jgi:hypothetical protein
MKHVGKMKNNGARVAVAYRTLPGDSGNALVIGTGNLPDSWHDTLMTVIQDPSGQQANDLADILSVRKFPDGSNMLEWLHSRGSLTKVPTKLVLMTPDTKSSIQLDELNLLIADQKGLTLEQLAITEGEMIVVEPNAPATQNKWDKAREDRATAKAAKDEAETVAAIALSPAEMRSRADALYKEAARLRKDADAVDPPKKKTKVEA